MSDGIGAKSPNTRRFNRANRIVGIHANITPAPHLEISRGHLPRLQEDRIRVIPFSFSRVNAGACGFDGWGSPLYAIESYQYTPFSGSILLFYGLI